MTEHIVVPLDRSDFAEKALPTARSLATVLGARLELVHVTWAQPPTEEEAYLEAVAASLAVEDVVTHVERGWPVPVLAELLESRSDAVLCMATRGRTGIGGLLLGSVADELLPKVAGPVVLVGPDYDAAAQPRLDHGGGALIVCFDGSDASGTIAPLAIAWAHALGLRTHVAMVLHRGGTFLGNEDASEPKQRARALTEQLVADGVPATLDLLDGLDPARAIADHVASLPATLVMTSTHGTGGIVRTALGSIAVRIARHACCPVVIRRPDGQWAS